MSHLSQNSQLHDNVKYPNVYVFYSTVQMFTRLGSISDTNLTFDVTVTANNEHLNEHYKVHVFDYIDV